MLQEKPQTSEFCSHQSCSDAFDSDVRCRPSPPPIGFAPSPPPPRISLQGTNEPGLTFSTPARFRAEREFTAIARRQEMAKTIIRDKSPSCVSELPKDSKGGRFYIRGGCFVSISETCRDLVVQVKVVLHTIRGRCFVLLLYLGDMAGAISWCLEIGRGRKIR